MGPNKQEDIISGNEPGGAGCCASDEVERVLPPAIDGLVVRESAPGVKPNLIGVSVPRGYSAEPVALSETLEAYGNQVASGEFKVTMAHRDSHVQISAGTVRERGFWEELQESTLVAGATRAIGAGNRLIEEEPDPFRTCFERDADRVRHAKVFRRLALKCQVYVVGGAGTAMDDHIRTRLTHSEEVAQIARGLARALGLNAELAEAAALAHDTGHGPCGHASEDAFSPYSPTGVHDHAVWGADVSLADLNLCAETLEAVRCHSWKLPAPSTPEGEVVSWADRIAYVCHDFDDAVAAGLIRPQDLPRLVRERVGERQSQQVRGFVRAMIATAAQTGRIGMDEEHAEALESFRRFNYENIYLRPAARKQSDKSVRLIRGLVDFYMDAPGRLPSVKERSIEHPEPYSQDAAAAAVKYVCGMTDRLALAQGVELLGYSPAELPRGV